MPLPKPGTTIEDRYELERVLGKGGFGVVFAARDRASGESVALKLLLPRPGAHNTHARRFEREVRIASDLDHRHFVRLLDHGVTADGSLYYTMDLLEGEDVSERLTSEGPIAPREAVRLVGEVLEALASAHDRDIVHRDIKPANIFLVDDGHVPHVKLLDFGIAKSLQSDPSTEITRTGRIVGTAKYMAPETITDGDHSPASDVYACALVLLEMITGRPVFDGSPMEILMRQVNDAPSIPDAVAGLPIAEFLRRALDKDPSRRFDDAGEAMVALSRTTDTLPGQPIAARSSSQPTGATVAVILTETDRAALQQSRVSRTAPQISIAVVDEVDDERWDRLVREGGREEEEPINLWLAALVGLGVVVASVWISRVQVAEMLHGPQIEPVSDTFRLRVDTHPPGAKIEIGEEEYGETPVAVTLEKSSLPLPLHLRNDEHTVRLVLREPRDQLVIPMAPEPEAEKYVFSKEVALDVKTDPSMDLDALDIAPPGGSPNPNDLSGLPEGYGDLVSGTQWQGIARRNMETTPGLKECKKIASQYRFHSMQIAISGVVDNTGHLTSVTASRPKKGGRTNKKVLRCVEDALEGEHVTGKLEPPFGVLETNIFLFNAGSSDGSSMGATPLDQLLKVQGR